MFFSNNFPLKRTLISSSVSILYFKCCIVLFKISTIFPPVLRTISITTANCFASSSPVLSANSIKSCSKVICRSNPCMILLICLNIGLFWSWYSSSNSFSAILQELFKEYPACNEVIIDCSRFWNPFSYKCFSFSLFFLFRTLKHGNNNICSKSSQRISP